MVVFLQADSMDIDTIPTSNPEPELPARPQQQPNSFLDALTTPGGYTVNATYFRCEFGVLTTSTAQDLRQLATISVTFTSRCTSGGQRRTHGYTLGGVLRPKRFLGIHLVLVRLSLGV